MESLFLLPFAFALSLIGEGGSERSYMSLKKVFCLFVLSLIGAGGSFRVRS